MSRYIGEVLCVVMRPMLVDAAVLQRCREAFEDRSSCDIDVYKSLWCKSNYDADVKYDVLGWASKGW